MKKKEFKAYNPESIDKIKSVTDFHVELTRLIKKYENKITIGDIIAVFENFKFNFLLDANQLKKKLFKPSSDRTPNYIG